jgi:hypothetical protein
MNPLHHVIHNARGEDYVIDVYNVVESGDIRVYAYRGGTSLIGKYGAQSDTAVDMRTQLGVNPVDLLIEQAKADIDAHEGGQFGLREYFDSLD